MVCGYIIKYDREIFFVLTLTADSRLAGQILITELKLNIGKYIR
jgi:hypothetical protein